MFGALMLATNSIGSPLGLFLGIVTTRATVLYANGAATELSQVSSDVTLLGTPSDSSTLLTASASEVILRGR